MDELNEKIPQPKELEKEIGDLLAKKFGDKVKIGSPIVVPQEITRDTERKSSPSETKIEFNLKPEELVSYLDQYIVKQDSAKAVLATKICTHFNRIIHFQASPHDISDMVGSIKNNVLMLGPTGVGKTYMIKLIARKAGVPFVKGDATKFSETGYVGGDVEDLVRDLVHEADDDIELAQYGIIYVDEIDKIASSRNLIGADVSRAGVQRGLLKPMEETEVELKVPHDPISMIQEIERFRKTGKRERTTVNTKNILFIMSGAFADLDRIIHKRTVAQGIGFGAPVTQSKDQFNILNQVTSEDLLAFGFESEFVGRLPVRAVFEKLSQEDLFEVLKNPNNPIMLGKKLDFAAYGIDVKFDDPALRILAAHAFAENTGARGLVSAVERALLPFEKKLPSTGVTKFPVTETVIEKPEEALKTLIAKPDDERCRETFERLALAEEKYIKAYVESNRSNLSEKYNLTLTESRVDIVAAFYGKHIMDIGYAVETIKSYYDEIKKIEMFFFKNHDINMVLEDEAIDFAIGQFIDSLMKLEDFYSRLTADFELGLKLIQEKSGRNRFFITREALISPESFLDNLIKNELKT